MRWGSPPSASFPTTTSPKTTSPRPAPAAPRGRPAHEASLRPGSRTGRCRAPCRRSDVGTGPGWLRSVPESGDGALGAGVAHVGLELHPTDVELVEGVAEQQQFGVGVDQGPPHRRSVGGGADLEPGVVYRYVEVTGHPHHGSGGQRRVGHPQTHHPREHARGQAVPQEVHQRVGVWRLERKVLPHLLGVESTEQLLPVLLESRRGDFHHASPQHGVRRRWPRHGRPHDVGGPGVGHRDEVVAGNGPAGFGHARDAKSWRRWTRPPVRRMARR